MEDLRDGGEFPGFQTCVHKEELEYKRPLSRLQRRAPLPLQINPNNNISSVESCKSGIKFGGCNSVCSSSSVAPGGSFGSFCSSKDPIPLLSPLVLPSLLESTYVQAENTAKSC